MVGLPAVGKSTIGNKISSEFNISHINKDRFRDFLIGNIRFFNDTPYSHRNPKIKLVNEVVAPAADKIILQHLKNGQSVIIDGYGKNKEKRDGYKELIKNYDYKIIIIYVKEKEETILKRLKKRDEEDKNSRWIETYYTRWKPTFSVPKKEECDELIEVETADEAIIKLRKFMS